LDLDFTLQQLFGPFCCQYDKPEFTIDPALFVQIGSSPASVAFLYKQLHYQKSEINSIRTQKNGGGISTTLFLSKTGSKAEIKPKEYRMLRCGLDSFNSP